MIGILEYEMEKSVSYHRLIMLSLFIIPTAAVDSKAVIATNVSQALMQFYAQDANNKDLADKAVGILIFPRIIKVA